MEQHNDPLVMPLCCILANDAESVLTFLTTLFSLPKVSSCTTLKNAQYYSLKLHEQQNIIVVKKQQSNERFISSIRFSTTKAVFVYVKNIAHYIEIASKNGFHQVDSHVEDNILTHVGIEGPEGIVVYFANNIKDFSEFYVHLMNSELETNVSTATNVTDDTALQNPISPVKPVVLSPPRKVRSNIPSLEVSILSNNSKTYVPMIPNAREPTFFETEIFIGHAYFAIKMPNEDPNITKFWAKKHIMEIQVQGKFKRKPLGEMYCGAESQEKMDLGIITRSLAKAVYNFASTMVSNLHLSLGDHPTTANYQAPHLVAPLFPTVDKIIVTPPGETPPPLGVPFVEDLDYRAKRFKFRKIADANIDLDTIYSFSVNQKNIDFVNWTFVGIPMCKPLDMRTFFGDSPIRLSSYEIPEGVAATTSNHPADALKYVFCVKLTSLDADKVVDLELLSDNEVSDDEDVDKDEQNLVTNGVNTSTEGATESSYVTDNNGGKEKLTKRSFILSTGKKSIGKVIADGLKKLTHRKQAGDATEDNPEIDATLEDFEELGDDDDNVEDPETGHKSFEGKGLFRRFLNLDMNRNNLENEGILTKIKNKLTDTTTAVIDVPETSEYVPMDYDMETSGDLQYCLFSVDINDTNRTNGRRTGYVIPHYDNVTLPVSGGASNSYTPRIRFYSEICSVFSMVPIPKQPRNKKFSQTEKRRRQIIETFKQLTATSPNSVNSNAYISTMEYCDKNFLNGNSSVVKVIHSHEQHSYDGYVALAVSRRHWTEQFMSVNKAEITLSNNLDSKKRKGALKVPLASILCVRPLQPEDFGIHCYSFMQVETFARVYYIMLKSNEQQDQWLDALTTFLGPEVVLRTTDRSLHLPRFAEQEDAYSAKPMAWKLERKRIHNYRCIIFDPAYLPRRLRDMHPCKLVESALEKCFLLSSHGLNDNANNPSDVVTWINFMDEISLLQTVDISILREAEKICFLLNLYHLMVLNGMLIFGPPPSFSMWQTFFNNFSYILAYDVVSIAELEHNILRAGMSRRDLLTNIYNKFAPPNSQFPQLALSHGDFRLNFCINSGSRSLSKMVPIYKAELLDRQLDEMTKITLAQEVTIDTRTKTIYLPEVCKWFLSDFTLKKAPTSTAYNDLLRVITPYLSSNDRKLLNIIKETAVGTHAPTFKFKNFNYKCRKFERNLGDYDET